MINYVNGDVLTVKKGIVAHGVNCRGAFGAGLAGQIRQKYPLVYDSYMDKYKNEGWRLGDVQFCYQEDFNGSSDSLIIANCATQYGYGTNKVQVDYNAISKVFSILLDYCEEHNLPLSLPRIGAGLAGGDWEKINSILEKEVEGRNVEVTVYTYE